MALTNVQVAELFARRAEQTEGIHSRKAYQRASREAMAWPEEVADVARQGRALTELVGIGPKLSVLLEEWLADTPDVPEPPANRQGFISMAEALVTIRDAPGWGPGLRGDLQMHTTYSDGTLTVAEMARAAHSYGGYEYVAITDHSGGQRIPSGMHPPDIARQSEEIDRANEELSGTIRILKGIEMNLTPVGEGDTDPEVLAGLDIVLGSFHSKLRETEDQTSRYLAALLNPDIQVLAHPQGRMYNRRTGLTADWEKVFAAAATLDKAVEFDCNPNRQDLRIELLELARDSGVRVSVGSDAHAPYEMTFVPLGVASLIRAGIPRDRLLNAMSAEEIVDWAASVRASSPPRRTS